MMRTAGRLLVAGWLLVALVLLALDDRMGVFVAWTVPLSLAGIGIGAMVRQQRAPSMLERSAIPKRYRAADDLAQPLAVVVEAAEQEAEDER